MVQTGFQLFKNGRIYSLDQNSIQHHSMLVYDGKIIAFDDEIEAYRSVIETTRDLEQQVIFPAFIESHAHPLFYAQNIYKIDCSPSQCSSIDEILKKIEKEAQARPEGSWILGYGWDDSLMSDKRNPHIAELDAVAPNHPVYLTRTCSHNAVANSAAFRASGLSFNVKNPEGGAFDRDKKGNITGLIQEEAMGQFKIPALTLEEQKQAFIKAQEDFLSWGITTLHDMAVTEEIFRVYQQLEKEGALKVRLRLWFWAQDQFGLTGTEKEVITLGLESLYGSDKLSVQGMKYMLDGSVGGKTAAVEEPFEMDTTSGILYMNQDKISEHVKKTINHGLRVAIHGIGERAIEMALLALENAADTETLKLMRNRIEHVTLATKDQLIRMKNNEIVAASSIGFIYSIGDSYIRNLGERVNRVFPHKTMKELGIVAPGNSDFPVCDGDPIYGIYSAAARKTKNGGDFGSNEAISLEDSFKAFTTDAAFSGFDEGKLGSLEVGKAADFILFSEDPFAMSLEAFKSLQVNETYIEGVQQYQRQSH